MGRVDAGLSLVERVDHDHRRADSAGAVGRPPQRIRQQHGPEPLSLTFIRDGQAREDPSDADHSGYGPGRTFDRIRDKQRPALLDGR